MSTRPLEQIASESTAPKWFQLYVLRDRELTLSLVRRAEDCGYGALVVTVDMPQMGRRERDLRNGFALPPHLSPGNFPPPKNPDLFGSRQGRSEAATRANRDIDPALDWSTVNWLRTHTSMPLILKGILTGEDARRAVEAGARGIIASNHGGRQLDGASASLDALQEVADAAGPSCTILLDGGIRRGTDALKARALGASGVLIGRPAIWGLAVNGAQGVADVLRMLKAEIAHSLVLAGRHSWGSVDGTLVARRHRTQ